jgi:hypothetical protein
MGGLLRSGHRAGDQLGEFVWAFDWCEVSGAIDGVQLGVGEELTESVRPFTRK